ncbi:AAA family ATPase [Streptomyces sp. NPDC102381]|uniref:AAA family ATPase n=1 Tax=Streptomyces sp. NPDC102381 TaxID=3366164 RepID=UPI003812908A
MAHVLWLGGAPGAGKSTVAERLARRHGLRRYHADTRTWAHRDRALAAHDEAAVRFETLPLDERWARPVDELLAMSLHRERGPMVVDDVRALPPAPLTVAEGTTITPGVARALPGRAALWLLPTPELLEKRLAERELGPGPLALYRRLAQEIAEEVRESGAPFLSVDGSADTTEEVARLWAGPLTEGPHAGAADERRALLREANEAVVAQIAGYFGRPWADGEPGDREVAFSCECGDASCTARVTRAATGLPAAPLLAAGHRARPSTSGSGGLSPS